MSDLASPARPRGRLRLWSAIAAALAVALLALVAFGLRPRPASIQTDRWVAARSRPLVSSITATGTVKLQAGASVRVGAQVSGLVRLLYVTVGSVVLKGDVIAKIDARGVKARTEQAQAQLTRTEVSAMKARADVRRAIELYAAGGLSLQQLDDLKGVSAVADATVSAARKDLAAASVDLAYVTIRAPIDGVVASVSTQQGETVASTFASPTFVTIIQPEALEVIATVDEADIGGVRLGQSATFTTETFPDRDFHGVVERIAPDATVISGVVNYEVTLAIRDDVAALKPQMTVNAVIVTGRRDVVTIPADAVQRSGGAPFVWVRRASPSPERRGVSLGATRNGEVEVARGLTADDTVLVRKDPKK